MNYKKVKKGWLKTCYTYIDRRESYESQLLYETPIVLDKKLKIRNYQMFVNSKYENLIVVVCKVPNKKAGLFEECMRKLENNNILLNGHKFINACNAFLQMFEKCEVIMK